jgi:PQQ-dependent catabolism-associated CXXCW motif protein
MRVEGRRTALTMLGAILGLLALARMQALAEELGPPEPDDYRFDEYRAPVPETLRGARVVTTAEAEAIWKRGDAAFIDVLPRPPKPANLPAGTIWRDKPRANIPGSLWLPDTGYGALTPGMDAYLRAGLAKASGGARGKMLVIYCLRECWMSWNAAKRAIAYGYRNIVWYPDGTDGWEKAGQPLAPATPEARPRE